MPILKYSKQESRLLGVKFARSNRLDTIPVKSLIKEVVDGDFDFCRIKINAAEKNTLNALNLAGIPYDIYSVIVRNEIDVNAYKQQLSFSELHFELYDGSQIDELKNVMTLALAQPTATNFTNTLFESVVSPKSLMEAACQFILSPSENFTSKHQRTWIVKEKNRSVGFVSGEISRSQFEGILHGVIPEFRGRSLGKQIMSFIIQYCKDSGIRSFCNDVVFQNLPSLANIIRSNISPIKTYLNLTLNPMMSSAKIRIGPLFFDSKTSEITTGIFLFVENMGLAVLNFQYVMLSETYSQTIAAFLQITPYSGTLQFVVVKVFNSEEKIQALLYLKCSGRLKNNQKL